MTEIREILRRDLSEALKAGSAERTSLIRSLIAAVENAEAIEPQPGDIATEAPRRRLTDADLLAIVTRERSELLAAAAEYERGGRAEEAARLRAHADVVERYTTLFEREPS